MMRVRHVQNVVVADIIFRFTAGSGESAEANGETLCSTVEDICSLTVVARMGAFSSSGGAEAGAQPARPVM